MIATRILPSTLALGITLGVICQPLLAQQPQPAVVISVASPNQLLSDLNFLAKSADAGQFVALAQFLAQQYLQMMDTTQPAGVMLQLNANGEPTGVGFLPINDYPRMKEMMKAQLGEPQSQGGGIDKISAGQPIFIKPQGKFVFVSPSIDALRNTPADPAKALMGLEKTYDLAIHCNIQNIPEKLKDFAISSLRGEVERGLNQANRTNPDPGEEAATEAARNMLGEFETLLDEAQSITLGWGVDQAGGKTYLDLAMAARPNTKMASKMGLAKQLTTTFAGFNHQNAALQVNFANKLGPEQIRHANGLIDKLEQAIVNEIEKEDGAAREKTQKVVTDVLTIIKKTVATGRMDGGGLVMMQGRDPKLQLAMGGYVADGATFERAFRDAVDLAKQEGKVPPVQFNAATHNGVTFHKLSITDLDNDAKKVFNGAMQVAIGFGAKTIYLGIGGEPVELLKQIIDKGSQTTPATPLQASLALTPIIEFAQAVDNAPAAAAILEALEQSGGRDHIVLVSQPFDNGIRYRLYVEDGIIRAVAKASGVK